MKIIVLAGGSGTRLWPISSGCCPKQFLRFGGEYSLLQKTLLRFLPKFSVRDIFIVTQGTYVPLVREHAETLDPAFKDQIIVEPFKKNTAPAVALGVKYLQEMGQLLPGETFLVAPSDALISPESLFLDSLPQAQKLAEGGAPVIFGIRPNRPETGYGYIKACVSGCVERFVEKPDYIQAQQFLLSGHYLWNAGIFLCEIDNFFDLLRIHCSDIKTDDFSEMLLSYGSFPDISIDYALLEKCAHLKVLPLDVSWSDVGSWSSIYDVLEKDHNENATLGNVRTSDTKKCLIIGDKRLISAVGLEEMIIVETEEALFLSKRY